MKISMSRSSRVTINGKSYVGGDVCISGDKVTIDGVVQGGAISSPVSVEVNGDVDTIDCEHGNITARNVKKISTGSGDIACGLVLGEIRTGSGDVNCGDVGGSIRTGSGDVIHK